MCFLSNYGRSGNLFVGSAISITHFAQFCAQRAWRGISAVDHSVDSEHWGYVHSTIPNALVDNILDRLLVYLHGVLNLIIPSDAPYGRSSKFAVETIIQNIKVSQTPISLSIGPLNRTIFIRRTKMRINDIMDLVKFVEATEDQRGSFASHLLRWRNTQTEVTAPISSTMVGSPFILSFACIKSCSTDVSISGAFWGTFVPRRSWDARSCKTRCLPTFLRTKGSFRRQQKETQENYHNSPHGFRP